MDLILIKAIKETIGYGQKFGVGYVREEIKERLITDRVFSDKEIEEGLEKIKTQNLKSIKTKYLTEKLQKAEELAKIIGDKFEDILMIGITGSVAAGYPKENDDIDLMIVTKKDKLWLTRLKLRLFIALYKIPHRKYGKTENKDEFCFNLWLDEGNLELPALRRILNNAMDLILMRPILNRKKTYEKFINANGWAKNYVMNGYKKKMINSKGLIANKKGRNIWDKLINWLVFWPQYWYMKNRLKQETVGFHLAFFHPLKDSDRIKV